MSTQTFISIDEALKNGNSPANQEIKSKLIQREVYSNLTTITEYILKKGYEDSESPFSMDDIENAYNDYNFDYTLNNETKSFEGTKQELDELIEELRDKQTDLENEGADQEIIDSYTETITDLEDKDGEATEIYEWWVVSDWLMNKLKEKGQPVIDTYPCLWGRCTTGQAILLDYVITQIAADMEILEGQRNSWANMK